MYTTQMITMLAWKLMRKDKWNLVMKMNAHGFHNLVLEYKDEGEPGYMYRLIQFESMIINNEMTINTLLSTAEDKKEFNLIELFKVYKATLEKITPADKIDVIIFSRRNIRNDDLDFFEEMDHIDQTIGFDTWGKQYRIQIHIIENKEDIMTSLRNICGDDQIIRNFLRSLIFMTAQPHVLIMEALLNLDIGKVFKVSQIFYNKLYKEINYWSHLNKENDGSVYLSKFYIQEYLEQTEILLLKAQTT